MTRMLAMATAIAVIALPPRLGLARRKPTVLAAAVSTAAGPD